MRNVKLLLATTIIAITSCSKRECSSNNSIFKHYEPASEEYKGELLKQLAESKTEKEYFLDGYTMQDSIPILHVRITGDNFCALAMVEVWRPDEKLKDIIKTNGDGYSGAQLLDFKMVMTQNHTSTNFVYQGMSALKD